MCVRAACVCVPYLVEDGAVAMEKGSVADVGVADHPAQVRCRPPHLEPTDRQTGRQVDRQTGRSGQRDGIG